MEDFVKRIIEERDQLEARKEKLYEFICGEYFTTIDSRQQSLLMLQLNAMNSYSSILSMRLDLLN